ncbi:Gfo/Idh/MocA family oxidoreductase, partial [bacterium AH-315-E10]|nr:Gfo/Idh/MocA family oxidoreductase [bacterium AH-315-E10]MBN4073968.1 Gfo/Idh/MocA family oxidoreductase [bacterium AH-315-E10]
MASLRFGILGTGGMAGGHAQRVQAHSETELVALCDVAEDIVEGFIERNLADASQEIAIYTDTQEMFDKADLDIVLIASPHTLHFEHGMQALAAGCHIFMEKPMVTDTEQAYKLHKEAEKQDKIVIIGYNTPCSPAFEAIRNTIRDGSLGKLELVTGYLSQDWMKLTKGLWRQKPELSGGGQAYDSGAHLLNSLVWSVESNPRQVSTFIDNHGTPVDINSVINVRFDNNVMASITVSGNCPASSSFMSFIFEDGRIDVDGWCGTWIKAFKGNEEFDIIPEDAKETNPLDNLIDAIQGKDEARTSPQNGIYQSELMDAVYKSAETGQVVT